MTWISLLASGEVQYGRVVHYTHVAIDTDIDLGELDSDCRLADNHEQQIRIISSMSCICLNFGIQCYKSNDGIQV